MSEILVVRVKDGRSKTGYSYKNHVDLHNPSLIALILDDLEKIFNAPIRKACSRYLKQDKQEEEKAFPI